MDGRIFGIARRICLLLFIGNIFVHACIGASLVGGIAKGSASMAAMFMLTVMLFRYDRKSRINKERKNRQKNEKGVSEKY